MTATKLNPTDVISTGTTPLGLKWARLGEYRITAYAMSDSFVVNRFIKGVGWVLIPTHARVPQGVLGCLKWALGIKQQTEVNQ
jgi:hypothetical protein